MPKLIQDKSKWQVVGDCGRVYSIHKTRKAAQRALDIKKAMTAWANGWNRLTKQQQALLTELGYDGEPITESGDADAGSPSEGDIPGAECGV